MIYLLCAIVYLIGVLISARYGAGLGASKEKKRELIGSVGFCFQLVSVMWFSTAFVRDVYKPLPNDDTFLKELIVIIITTLILTPLTLIVVKMIRGKSAAK